MASTDAGMQTKIMKIKINVEVELNIVCYINKYNFLNI